MNYYHRSLKPKPGSHLLLSIPVCTQLILVARVAQRKIFSAKNHMEWQWKKIHRTPKKNRQNELRWVFSVVVLYWKREFINIPSTAIPLRNSFQKHTHAACAHMKMCVLCYLMRRQLQLLKRICFLSLLLNLRWVAVYSGSALLFFVEP